jgi:carnitine monooxygenase subunit
MGMSNTMSETNIRLAATEDRFSSDPEVSYTLAAPYYYDEALFRSEQSRVFAQSWRFACHRTEIPHTGDYVTLGLDNESILIIRDKDETIRAFYNVCPHRASQLVKPGSSGNKPSGISCPYHSWTFNHDGTLRGASRCERVKNFNKEDFSLTPVRVEELCGFIFISLNIDAPSLGAQAVGLDDLLNRECTGLEDYSLVARSDFDVKTNWKVIIDNFIENYHLTLSGPEHKKFADLVSSEEHESKIRTHDVWTEFISPAGRPDNSAFQWTEPRNLGGGNDFITIHLFPDMGFVLFPGVNALSLFYTRPTGPETCTLVTSYYAPTTELDEATKAGVHYFSDELSPEDIELCEGVQRGLRSRAYHQGRLMVDAERTGLSEHGVHAFHAWIRSFMLD